MFGGSAYVKINCPLGSDWYLDPGPWPGVRVIPHSEAKLGQIYFLIYMRLYFDLRTKGITP